MIKMNLKSSLYSYQEEAVEKLSHVKVGALFMDMGTGKTRVALELIYRRLIAGKITHVIWLCPCTVLVTGNLLKDIKKHCEVDSNFFTICGIESLSTSNSLNQKMMNLSNQEKCYLIVDESLLVKNPYALRSRNITRLAEACEYKLILNGTPISKHEPDLFQQYYILDWRILGYRSFWSFAANHLEYDDKFKGKIRRVLNIDYLTDKIAPFTVEIRKEDVLNLPEKKYSLKLFYLPDEQREEYDRVKEEFLSLQAYESDFETPIIYRTFNALQQITSGEAIATKAEEIPISHYHMYPNPMDNPRIRTLADTLKQMSGEKVVIWCKFTHEIDAIAKMIIMEFAERPSLCHGKMSAKQKRTAIEHFSNESHFLIANKGCAGFGLNLQFCHNAVFYNNDWDWATREQAEDRMHRIGQTHAVNIIDIASIEIIDKRIIQCLKRKENLLNSFKAHLKEKNFADLLDGKDVLNDKDWIDRKPKAKSYHRTG